MPVKAISKATVLHLMRDAGYNSFLVNLNGLLASSAFAMFYINEMKVKCSMHSYKIYGQRDGTESRCVFILHRSCVVKNDSSKVGDVTDPPPYMPLN